MYVFSLFFKDISYLSNELKATRMNYAIQTVVQNKMKYLYKLNWEHSVSCTLNNIKGFLKPIILQFRDHFSRVQCHNISRFTSAIFIISYSFKSKFTLENGKETGCG